MMNLVALSLVVTSLAAAGVLSPTPQTHHKHASELESTIIKEGHRVVVVEYDEDGHQNTKISISPEAPSVPPNDASFIHAPKDLICDTYGKCEQKIEGAIGKPKDKVSETAQEAGREVGDPVDKTRDAANDASFLHVPKELICDAYGKCKRKITGAMVKARDKISETTAREVGNTVGKAKEAVSNKAHDIQDSAKESAEKVKDVGKKISGDMARNVSREEVKEAVKDIASYIGMASMEMLHSITNVLNLLGFATAYGLCVWVTFVSSYVLSRVIPRQQLGVVQSKIYPVYFKVMAYSIGLALSGHILSKQGQTLQAYKLLASLVATLINSIYLEPRATKAMFERMKVEKEEGRGREDIAQPRGREEYNNTADPKESTTTEQDAVRSRIIRLNDKLKRLNSYSSFLNILSLMSLTWHLIYLAQLVHHCS